MPCVWYEGSNTDESNNSTDRIRNKEGRERRGVREAAYKADLCDWTMHKKPDIGKHLGKALWVLSKQSSETFF